MCWPGAIIIPAAAGIIIPGPIIIPCPPAGIIEPRPSGVIIMPCVLRGTMPLSIGDPDAIGNASPAEPCPMAYGRIPGSSSRGIRCIKPWPPNPPPPPPPSGMLFGLNRCPPAGGWLGPG